MNHTLWDDFPYVHYQSNNDIHFAASFLSWHRYIIHTYHHALVTECDYNGELPYWDWTLDWQDLSAAPVWDLDHGFSGNGRESSEPSPFFPRSHCIEEGPFAHVHVSLAGATYAPHCLTRDFGSFKHEPVANLSQHLRPRAIEALMEEDDYYKFLVKFEDGAHIAIPKFIMGDFRLFTSPNDPIFFLHHGQIDRIWWRWQQHDLQRRQYLYTGSFKPRSEKQASLDDIVSVGGLAPDVKASELMNVRSGIFCYTY
ncbi:tyrosinase [Alternaria panax]|uniref:Tyrosinase n=1 Tax=Alternaria panax TaxID=48097 RepID=A0AAD4NRB5_9PLEO|nr:tyrosinase [Alternaria panax]